MAVTTLKILSDTIYAEMQSHLILDALNNLPPKLSAEEKQKIADDTNAKSQKFCMSLSKAIMQCMVASSGSYPVLYCTVPGLTAIDDVSQIGISTSTLVGD